MSHQQLPREASGDCCCILGIAAQSIHLIFPPLPKDKAEPNIALKINIRWGRASRILINACRARRGIPKILGTQVAALSPSAINYPQLILADSTLGSSAGQADKGNTTPGNKEQPILIVQPVLASISQEKLMEKRNGAQGKRHLEKGKGLKMK